MMEFLVNNEVCSWEILVPTIKKSWEDCRLPVVDVCVDSFFNDMFEAHSDSERYTRWIDCLIAVMNDIEKDAHNFNCGIDLILVFRQKDLIGKEKKEVYKRMQDLLSWRMDDLPARYRFFCDKDWWKEGLQFPIRLFDSADSDYVLANWLFGYHPTMKLDLEEVLTRVTEFVGEVTMDHINNDLLGKDLSDIDLKDIAMMAETSVNVDIYTLLDQFMELCNAMNNAYYLNLVVTNVQLRKDNAIIRNVLEGIIDAWCDPGHKYPSTFMLRFSAE